MRLAWLKECMCSVARGQSEHDQLTTDKRRLNNGRTTNYEKFDYSNFDDSCDNNPVWADLSTRCDRPGPGNVSRKGKRAAHQEIGWYGYRLAADRSAFFFAWLLSVATISRGCKW